MLKRVDCPARSLFWMHESWKLKVNSEDRCNGHVVACTNKMVHFELDLPMKLLLKVDLTAWCFHQLQHTCVGCMAKDNICKRRELEALGYVMRIDSPMLRVAYRMSSPYSLQHDASSRLERFSHAFCGMRSAICLSCSSSFLWRD